jgi:lysozyme family protein
VDINQIIEDILRREGGHSNDPSDHGGRTQFGISESANPSAWADGRVTADEARDIYYKKYVVGPGFDKVEDSGLQAQLVDFGVNSGPAIAIMKVQGLVGVKADGILGPTTLDAINSASPMKLGNHLVAERIRMLAKIVSKSPSQAKFLSGWVNRALEFLT